MTADVRERKFEEAIEAALVTEAELAGTTAAEQTSGAALRALSGYHKRLARLMMSIFVSSPAT